MTVSLSNTSESVIRLPATLENVGTIHAFERLSQGSTYEIGLFDIVPCWKSCNIRKTFQVNAAPAVFVVACSTLRCSGLQLHQKLRLLPEQVNVLVDPMILFTWV